MSLARPWVLLLLFSLLPLWALARAAGPSPRRLRRASLALRAGGLTLLVVALAGPEREQPAAAQVEQVAVVVDVSSSVAPGAALAAVRSVVAAHPGAALVATAGRAELVSDLAALAALPDLDRGATDLAAGVRLAGAALRAPGRSGRVVLISDGRATQGDLSAEARSLAQRGIAVEEVRVASRPRALLGVRPSRAWVRSGEPLELAVDLAGTGRLVVERRGPEGPPQRWERPARPGRVVIRDRVRGRGLATYTATVADERLRAVVPVRRAPRARVIEGEPGASALVARALFEGGFEVEVSTGARPGGPFVEEVVVLVDLPLRGSGALAADRQRALVAWVRGGGGLFVVGGRRAFGPGGYRGSPLESISPVRSQPARSELPVLALVLVLDRSSSMAGPKLELAKLAAADALAQLAPRDLGGAIVFNQRALWAIPLARGAPSGARARVEIHAAGGGTDLEPALRLAGEALSGARAKVKHVVVLTDGIVPKVGALRARARELAREGVTVSTVALGGDADHTLLRALARDGGGRHHAAPVAADLPRILVRETRRVARLAGRTPPFQARLERPGEILRGIDVGRSPALLGLAETEARATATVWLSGASGRPLLAGWDVGAGRVVAWTSDAGARWARPWADWAGFPRLVRQAARRLTPAQKALPAEEPIPLTWERGGLQLRARDPGGLRLILRGPQGAEHGRAVVAWASGRGEVGGLDLPRGSHEVALERSGVLVALAGVSWPPPGPERGVAPAGIATTPAFAAGEASRRRAFDAWVLLAALGLLVVEVACRRWSR